MSPIRNYISQLRRFQSNARLYLVYSFASGFAMGIMRLLFNFYVLSLGHERAFLGALVALPPLVVTFAAIPAGMVGHRIGYRSTLIGGAVLMVASVLGISFSSAAIGLVLFSIGRGFSQTLLQVSSAPFMAENSEATERTHLFSVQFATQMLASFFGLLLAGVLPSLVARAISIGAEDPLAYRASFWVGAGLLAAAIFPLLRMTRLADGAGLRPRPKLREMFKAPGQLIRLFLPQVIIGFGAGALVPFLNVFFKTEFGLSDSVIGVLYAFQSVVMALATFVAPIVAERLRRIRAVVFLQLLSIPFLVLLGYAPLVSLSVIGFLARASLMNMGNPLYTAFAMEAVPPERRPTASALMQMSWQGTRGLSALVSGQLQQGPGFGAIFPITIGCYLLASTLIYRFFGRRE
jgi:MFS family permease